MAKAILLLEDGRYYIGKSCGVSGEVCGEVVFNTGMTGYQEILSDPSYTGQMVVLTYPLIGNYGINYEDNQSDKLTTSALIVKEIHQHHGNYRAEENLNDYLTKNNIIGFYDIDTRSLVLHIREHGSMKGIVSTDDFDLSSLQEKLRKHPDILGQDLVKGVTTPYVYQYDVEIDHNYTSFPKIETNNRVNTIAVFDFGIKSNILRYLKCIAKKVLVFPADTGLEEVMKCNPSGVFLSNGPGDPEGVTYGINNVRKLLKEFPSMPVLGVCLGHQIIALALNGRTYKMKFGHHGVNQPVKNLFTGRVEITSQNHCFAVDVESLADAVKITHINLNDSTLEGMQLLERPVFSVQYHPEAGPGPNDSNYIFEKFYRLITG